MKYILSFALTFAFLCIESCDPYDMKLIIVNRSSQNVFFDISKTGKFKSHPIVLDEKTMDTTWDYINWVNANDYMKVPAIGNSWDGFINNECIDSTLTVFIFTDSLLKNVPKDSIVKFQMCTKKLNFKVADLNKIKWRIEFD